MSPDSPPSRLPILHPSLFSTPVKTFHLPVYANAMAHQSIVNNSSPILDDFAFKNLGVLKYFDISAVEDNQHDYDSEHSDGSSQQAASTSDSS